MQNFLKSPSLWKTLIGACLAGLMYLMLRPFDISLLFSDTFGFGVHRAFLAYLVLGGVIGFGWHMLTRNK